MPEDTTFLSIAERAIEEHVPEGRFTSIARAVSGIYGKCAEPVASDQIAGRFLAERLTAHTLKYMATLPGSRLMEVQIRSDAGVTSPAEPVFAKRLIVSPSKAAVKKTGALAVLICNVRHVVGQNPDLSDASLIMTMQGILLVTDIFDEKLEKSCFNQNKAFAWKYGKGVTMKELSQDDLGGFLEAALTVAPTYGYEKKLSAKGAKAEKGGTNAVLKPMHVLRQLDVGSKMDVAGTVVAVNGGDVITKAALADFRKWDGNRRTSTLSANTPVAEMWAEFFSGADKGFAPADLGPVKKSKASTGVRRVIKRSKRPLQSKPRRSRTPRKPSK